MMAPLDRRQLAAICGRLGSAFEGERANAAALADRMVRQAGMTWHDVIVAIGRSTDDEIAFCHERRHALTAWEREFVASVRRRITPLTGPQLATLRGIVQKLRRGAGHDAA